MLALALATAAHAQPVSAASAPSAASGQRVEVPSLEERDGLPLLLPGFWFPVDGRAGAVLLLHGCGGPYVAPGRTGRLSSRMREYAALLNGQGWHVLVTDSLTPRGERELCTQRIGGRAVTQVHRRADALGALRWLAGRSEVDAARLGLVGWSHGGSAVLTSTNGRHADVAAAPRPAFAVAYYPGCDADRRAGYTATAPLLLMIGEADDWTPAAPCRALADAAGPAVRYIGYAGAYHGFDGNGPVKLRTEVPNGVRPGQGVHLGGDPAAREDSRRQLVDWLRLHSAPVAARP